MKTEEALQTAKELISGPRAKTYGDKVVNHGNIAKLWSAYIDKELTAHDAAVMLALLKVARTKFGNPTEDTYIDAAAYMAIAGECKFDGEGEDWKKGYTNWKKSNK
jgi:hypothetical protein|tara:strand:+ start:137 stop:454 length:318 start_codon:yes stop_codon:yes gene_type:complete